MNTARNLTERWRRARRASRRSQEMNRALIGASPALRDELLEIANRD